LKTGLTVAAVLIPLPILAGDLHGLNTPEHQPQKAAAREANWETHRAVPLVPFALPDAKARKNHFAIAVPSLASLILTHALDGEVPGLNDFPEEHPPVAPLFFGFRLMVGIGLLMLVVSWVSVFLIIRNAALGSGMLRVVIAMTFSGWVATLAGWYMTEIGRQPWLVTGVLKTAEAVTTVPTGRVGLSLALYALVYVALLIAYVHTLFYMSRKSVTVEEYETLTDLGPMQNGVGNTAGEKA